MKREVHGHEVLGMLLAAPRAYTRASLRAALLAQYGSETRFFTCSASDMTVDELIGFLAERQKFVEDGTGVIEADPTRICDHDAEHPHHD